jgi:hypothetical protein
MKMQKCPKAVLSAFTLEDEVQRTSPPKSLGSSTFSKLWRQEFGLLSKVWVEQNARPKLPSRGRTSFPLNNQSLSRSWPLDLRGYFEQGIKCHAPLSLDFGLGLWRLHTLAVQVERLWEFMAKGLDFGLGLWRLHTMPGRRLHLVYFIDYFQLISLDSQQNLATQSHGLSTWTAIV